MFSSEMTTLYILFIIFLLWNCIIKVFQLHNHLHLICGHIYVLFMIFFFDFWKKCFSTISTKNTYFAINTGYYASHSVEANNNRTCMRNIMLFSAIKSINKFYLSYASYIQTSYIDLFTSCVFVKVLRN